LVALRAALTEAGEDAQTKARTTAFLQELSKFGWSGGHNLRIDRRAGAGSAVTTRKNLKTAKIVGITVPSFCSLAPMR
jgi:hypothetical protein